MKNYIATLAFLLIIPTLGFFVLYLCLCFINLDFLPINIGWVSIRIYVVFALFSSISISSMNESKNGTK